MNIEKVDINTIRPYWRNPRDNTKAVEAVKASINEYGYNQPIVLDADNVIVVGHTRYMALRQLDYKTVDVIRVDLTEQQAKEYRIADNKTSEKSTWDFDALLYELRELESLDTIDQFFDDGEISKLLEIDDSLFNPKEEKELLEELDTIVRAQIAPNDSEDTEAIEAQIKEEVETRFRQELADQRNEQIRKLEKERKNVFARRSEDNKNDLITVQCPHCNEKMILSIRDLQGIQSRQV